MRKPTPLTFGVLIVAVGTVLLAVSAWVLSGWDEIGPMPQAISLVWVGAPLAVAGFLVVLYGLSEKLVTSRSRD